MVGRLLGNRYEIMEKIGEGGMAEVYKAKCHLLNRFVSVKVLKKEYSQDKDFVEKFKREATSAASLSDNNIVNIYDVGTEDNINYIVMEYVKGKTLKEIILQQGKLDYSSAISIALQIAKALECAHRNNIVHRDIKPHNILVTEDGVVKVTDFGIAKAASAVTITNTSKVMGSAHYFSPEQAKGSYVDARTDIYSLGIVLYEMVTGRVPFDAESPVSVALKHIQETVIPPRDIVPSIPESLNKLILKAVEKEPIRRYQSIRDMIYDLQRIKNNAEDVIIAPSMVDDHTRVMDAVVPEEEIEDERSFLDSRSKKILVFSLLGVLIVALGALSGWYIFGRTNGSNPSSKQIAVPNIIGKSKDEAKQMVEAAGLIYTEVVKQNSTEPEGTILNCNPTVGTNVLKGSEVRVSISIGQAKTKMPSLKDMDLTTAKQIISNAGLPAPDVKEEFNSTVAKGSVISQTPEVDTPIDSTTKVSLVVSKGPEEVKATVPPLQGLTIGEANTKLQVLKLVLSTNIKYIDTTDKSKDGKIELQLPAAGSLVKEGTAIEVTVNRYSALQPVQVPIESWRGNFKETETKINNFAATNNITIKYVDSVTGKPLSGAPKNNDTITGADKTSVISGDTLTISIEQK